MNDEEEGGLGNAESESSPRGNEKVEGRGVGAAAAAHEETADLEGEERVAKPFSVDLKNDFSI